MSKTDPPPLYTAASSASSSSDSLSSNNDTISWLSTGFINDKFSTHCQRAQGRPFLRTTVRPAIGQRVELTCFLASSERDHLPFRLSGEVVNDRVLPMPGCEEGLVDTITDNAQVVAAGELSSMSNSSHNHREDTNDDTPIQFCWRPSSSPNDCGVNGGSMALAHMIRSFISNQRPSLVVTPEHLKDVWENKLTCENKEKIANAIVQKLGALHGRRVVCEGRLNFDYDIRRGTEEGPWIDAIPFDGRDVWQFTLVADDSLENMWRVDPASFVNLGPAHRPRCWPWSNDVELPYGRSGTDKDLRGLGPNGAISVHICVGPHGCSGKDHPHSYQAHAA